MASDSERDRKGFLVLFIWIFYTNEDKVIKSELA